jgi:hypothetical protein
LVGPRVVRRRSIKAAPRWSRRMRRIGPTVPMRLKLSRSPPAPETWVARP